MDLGRFKIFFQLAYFALEFVAEQLAVAAAISLPLVLPLKFLVGLTWANTFLVTIVYFTAGATISYFMMGGGRLTYFLTGMVVASLVSLALNLAPLARLGYWFVTVVATWGTFLSLRRRHIKKEEEEMRKQEQAVEEEIMRKFRKGKEERARKWKAYAAINVATSLLETTTKEDADLSEPQELLEKSETLYDQEKYTESKILAELARSKYEAA